MDSQERRYRTFSVEFWWVSSLTLSVVIKTRMQKRKAGNSRLSWKWLLGLQRRQPENRNIPVVVRNWLISSHLILKGGHWGIETQRNTLGGKREHKDRAVNTEKLVLMMFFLWLSFSLWVFRSIWYSSLYQPHSVSDVQTASTSSPDKLAGHTCLPFQIHSCWNTSRGFLGFPPGKSEYLLISKVLYNPLFLFLVILKLCKIKSISS